MGRRKKVSQSPIKMVIGRSPEQNKGKDGANYTVLTQSGMQADTDTHNYRYFMFLCFCWVLNPVRF